VDCSDDAAKDIDGDWEHWVPVTLPEIPLDATNEPLDLWAFTGVEGEVVVNVEGADMTEILFDCGGLHGPEAQLGHPFHDRKPGSRQWGTIRIGQTGVELDEVKELALPCAVGVACRRCEAVPKEEGAPSRERRVRLIPMSRGSVVDGWRLREGASVKSCLYW